MQLPRNTRILAVFLATPILSLSVLQGGEKAAELEGSAKAFAEAWSSGDSEALGAQYAKDALMFPPNGPTAEGRKAITDAFKASSTPGATLWLKDVESSINGSKGFKWGHYKVKDADGNVVDKGRYMETRKNVDGEWLIDRDIYNSSLPPVAANMSATKAAIDGFVAVWNNRELNGLDAVLTDDFTRTSPSGNADGREAMKEAMQKLFTAYPDLAIELHKTQYFNDGAALHWQFTGTNTGPGDTPPTGKPVTLDGLTLLKTRDGKIASEDVRFDALNWFQQLGYVLQAPE